MHTVKYSKMRKFSYYSTFRPLNLHSDYDILILLEYRTERTSIITFLVTVHAHVPSNGICRGFAFKYGKFLLPPRFLTALSVPKVPTRVQ